ELHASVQQLRKEQILDTYRFTRRGLAGVFTVEANSMEHARSLAEKFFKAVLSDATWNKIIHVESCVGCGAIRRRSRAHAQREREALRTAATFIQSRSGPKVRSASPAFRVGMCATNCYPELWYASIWSERFPRIISSGRCIPRDGRS